MLARLLQSGNGCGWACPGKGLAIIGIGIIDVLLHTCLCSCSATSIPAGKDAPSDQSTFPLLLPLCIMKLCPPRLGKANPLLLLNHANQLLLRPASRDSQKS
jgi:hypothetical protein